MSPWLTTGLVLLVLGLGVGLWNLGWQADRLVPAKVKVPVWLRVLCVLIGIIIIGGVWQLLRAH
jgi:hypothetical protein